MFSFIENKPSNFQFIIIARYLNKFITQKQTRKHDKNKKRDFNAQTIINTFKRLNQLSKTHLPCFINYGFV